MQFITSQIPGKLLSVWYSRLLSMYLEPSTNPATSVLLG